jgi:hypothetical protein
MEEKFINKLIETLKENIYDLKDFILTKRVSDKAIIESFGIYYDDIKSKTNLKEKIINESLSEAFEKGLIDISCYDPKSKKINNYSMIKISKKDYYEIKEKEKTRAEMIKTEINCY